MSQNFPQPAEKYLQKTYAFAILLFSPFANCMHVFTCMACVFTSGQIMLATSLHSLLLLERHMNLLTYLLTYHPRVVRLLVISHSQWLPHGLGTLYRNTSERAFSFRLPPRTEDRSVPVVVP